MRSDYRRLPSHAVHSVCAQDTFLRSVWVAAGESPEWIVARTDALLKEVGRIVGVETWLTTPATYGRGHRTASQTSSAVS